jgi:hypothetical protein
MGACFGKYPVETKEEIKKRYESYDRSDLQLVVTMRMYVYAKSTTKEIKDVSEIENLSNALLSHDPHQIHIALHTCSGTTPHEPNECYYKTLAGSKCPMSTSNVSYA